MHISVAHCNSFFAKGLHSTSNLIYVTSIKTGIDCSSKSIYNNQICTLYKQQVYGGCIQFFENIMKTSITLEVLRPYFFSTSFNLRNTISAKSVRPKKPCYKNHRPYFKNLKGDEEKLDSQFSLLMFFPQKIKQVAGQKERNFFSG